jgi:hypothetical protein
MRMVTALGGRAAAAATILLASLEVPGAAEFGLAVDPEISPPGALPVGEAQHV